MNQKGNGLIIGVVIGALVVLGLFGAYYLGTKQTQPQSVTPAVVSQPTLIPTIIQTNVQPVSITLPINILKTTFGIDGDSVTYPKTITVSIPQQFSDQVSAYGAGSKVIVGLKGWTGSGSMGADGSNGATIYSNGGSADIGPSISYQEYPACVGCILGEAAKYFPLAKTEYLKTFPAPLNSPAGLVVHPISDSLVKYTLPDTKDGLKVNGVAYYGTLPNYPNSLYFIGMKVTLPNSQSDLSDALLNIFIIRQNLK